MDNKNYEMLYKTSLKEGKTAVVHIKALMEDSARNATDLYKLKDWCRYTGTHNIYCFFLGGWVVNVFNIGLTLTLICLVVSGVFIFILDLRLRNKFKRYEKHYNKLMETVKTYEHKFFK